MADKGRLIIIGSGPAGWTAAVYSARAELKPLVLAGEKSGGQLINTTMVENWPGAKDGVMGPELMMNMREQAEKFGAEVVDKYVTWVDFKSRLFRVGVGIARAEAPNDKSQAASKLQTQNTNVQNRGDVFEAKSVIIATGAESIRLGVPGESELFGRGVATCAVCDAPFYKDKVTFVVGGGDAAVEETLALTKYARSVTMLVRRDALRASKVMARRVEENPKVRVMWNSELREVKGKDKVEAVVVVNNKTDEKQELPTDGVFLAIGHKPVTEMFKGKVELDDKGYLVTGVNGLLQRGNVATGQRSNDGAGRRVDESLWLEGYPTMTSVDGVFGAGDVVDFRYRQAVTAAGMGCMAALDAERWLEKKGD